MGVVIGIITESPVVMNGDTLRDLWSYLHIIMDLPVTLQMRKKITAL